jgi:hypothetical protein
MFPFNPQGTAPRRAIRPESLTAICKNMFWDRTFPSGAPNKRNVPTVGDGYPSNAVNIMSDSRRILPAVYSPPQSAPLSLSLKECAIRRRGHNDDHLSSRIFLAAARHLRCYSFPA